MRITIDYPDEIDQELMQEAKKDGHENRSAIIRKAINFFLDSLSSKSKQKESDNKVKAKD
jgi:metal-responsive CopG/Arc/MetJ family transcriptional regulator